MPVRRRDKHDGCIICGEVATKTHVIPRALMHDLRRDSPHLVAGSNHTPGIEFTQSGLWDYLLCQAHEAMLGKADLYGVGFCRGKMTATGPQLLTAANPQPALLSKFVLATIWRAVHSGHGRALEYSLGSHEAVIRDVLFEGLPPEYLIMVTTSQVGLAGEAIHINSLPTPSRIQDLNCWGFTVSGLSFYAFVTKQAAPQVFGRLHAGRLTEVPVMRMPIKDIRQNRSFQDIFGQMARSVRPK